MGGLEVWKNRWCLEGCFGWCFFRFLSTGQKKEIAHGTWDMIGCLLVSSKSNELLHTLGKHNSQSVLGDNAICNQRVSLSQKCVHDRHPPRANTQQCTTCSMSKHRILSHSHLQDSLRLSHLPALNPPEGIQLQKQRWQRLQFSFKNRDLVA